MHETPDDPRGPAAAADAALQEAIRARAYGLWEAEGRPEGRALEHWLRAEAELAPRPVATQSIAGEEDPLAGLDQEPIAPSR
ncbi:MAG TPA: DUF2934 domain-containing protein [Geminicoccaceae bacterium]|nr:DUF2934 domain-containing protein [Geminicoccaceae bacterium]